MTTDNGRDLVLGGEQSGHAQAVGFDDVQFGRTVEAWHGAQYELDKTRHQLAADRARLRVAKKQERLAVARVRARLIALYESSDEPTTISILLGSSTVSDNVMCQVV